MHPPPRSLRFAVGTSLLSASLSLAGCDDTKTPPKDQPTVNPKEPVDTPPAPEEDHVNVGPEQATPEPEPRPELEPIHVNEGPQPEPEPKPEPKPAPDEKRVNVQPTPG
jgi:hypothetical protein